MIVMWSVAKVADQCAVATKRWEETAALLLNGSERGGGRR